MWDVPVEGGVWKVPCSCEPLQFKEQNETIL